MNVQVATEANFRCHQGFDLAAWDANDEEDPAAPRIMRFLKTTTIADFTQQLATTFNLDADLIRPWLVVNRQNGTKRPDTPIEPFTMSLEEAAAKGVTRQQVLKVWIEETTRDASGKPVWESSTGSNAKRPFIVFLKYFDPESQELKGAGHAYMKPDDKVSELTLPILKIMNWDANTKNIRLYEEIKPNFVETMKPKQTLQASEIQDGDIVCFQKDFSGDEVAAIQQKSPSAYLEAPMFYDYLLNRILVHFGPKPSVTQHINLTEEDDRFSLFLSKKDTYDNLTIKVAEHLSKVSKTTVDSSHMRFTTVNSQTNKPRTLVKKTPTATLATILQGVGGGYGGYGYSNQAADALYYEVLEMSISDLEQRKTVKIIWLSDGIQKEVGFSVCLSLDLRLHNFRILTRFSCQSKARLGTFYQLFKRRRHYPMRPSSRFVSSRSILEESPNCSAKPILLLISTTT